MNEMVSLGKTGVTTPQKKIMQLKYRSARDVSDNEFNSSARRFRTCSIIHIYYISLGYRR